MCVNEIVSLFVICFSLNHLYLLDDVVLDDVVLDDVVQYIY